MTSGPESTGNTQRSAHRCAAVVLGLWRPVSECRLFGQEDFSHSGITGSDGHIEMDVAILGGPGGAKHLARFPAEG